MSTLTTTNVTQNPTLIYGFQGSDTGPMLLVNTDQLLTVYVGNSSAIQPGVNTIPLTPGSSLSFDGSVSIYGVCVPGQSVIVAQIPGGTTYTPGNVSISGPVTAEISGPVDATITDPVTVEGTVAVSGTVNADVTGAVNANITNSSLNANITGGTVNANVTGGSMNANITNASITANVSNSSLNVVGAGGYIVPGGLTKLNSNLTTTIAANGTYNSSVFDCSTFQSIDISLSTTCPPVTGAAYCTIAIVSFYDNTGTHIIGQYQVGLLNNCTQAFSVPCLGSNVQIQLSNVGTNSITVGMMLFYGTYRNLCTPVWNYSNGRGSMLQGITGQDTSIQWQSINGAFGAPKNGICWGSNPAPALNTLYGYLLPPVTGNVTGTQQTTGDPSAAPYTNFLTLVDLTMLTRGQLGPGTAGSPNWVQAWSNTNQGAASDFNFNMPFSNCCVVAKTAASGTLGNFNLTMTGQVA